MTIDKEIGLRVKVVRDLKDVSQSDVAKHLGITQSAYSRLESGGSSWYAHHVVNVARFLKISITLILPV